MASHILPDLLRGLIAPVVRLLDATERRGPVRLSRRERARLHELDDRMLKDIGLERHGDGYRPR